MNTEVIFFYLTIVVFCAVQGKTDNKYSKEANVHKDERVDDHDFRPISLKHLDRPFRMAKLNLLWSKAVLVSTVAQYFQEM